MELENSSPSPAPAEISAPSQTADIETSRSTPHEASLPEVYELEKLSKFKFQGQELTPKDLEKAVLFQKDYTKRTQALAEERRQHEAKAQAFEDDQRFQSNLQADLKIIRQHPNLAEKFLETYPAKYHPYLQQVLAEISVGSANRPNQNVPNYDVLALTKEVNELRSVHNEQKIQTETARLDGLVKDLSQKYPDAMTELVLGRVYTAWTEELQKDPNARIADQSWEETFKAVDQEMKDIVKKKYNTRVKQQLEANSKARGTPVGGAAPGRAPQKFRNIGDVTKAAVNRLRSS